MAKKTLDVKKMTLVELATLAVEHDLLIKVLEKKRKLYRDEIVRRNAKVISGFTVAITERTRFNSVQFLKSIISADKIDAAKESGEFKTTFKELKLAKV